MLQAPQKLSGLHQELYSPPNAGWDGSGIETDLKCSPDTRQWLQHMGVVASGPDDQEHKAKVPVGINSTLTKKASFLESLLSKSRRFNLDPVPKLLYSRGPIIDLIIRAGIGPSLEFQLISSLYYEWEGRLERVPGSKEDIFSNDSIGLLEKRKLMKFFTTAMKFDESCEVENVTFYDHLKGNGISEKLINVIISAIAMKTGDKSLQETSLKDGILAVKQHLISMGRFGDGAFLTAIYGTGSELCQAFCRYAAVYGGLYMLDTRITSIVRGPDGKKWKVEVNGDQYLSDAIVVSSEFQHLLPGYREQPQFQLQASNSIERMMVISNSAFLGDEGSPALVVTPPISGTRDSIIAIQFNGSTQICPEGICTYRLYVRMNLSCN